METMKEWKNVLSDVGVSMDRQWMIDKIYEVIWWFYIPCKNCWKWSPNVYWECWCSYGSKCKDTFVMIWDVLDRINKNCEWRNNFKEDIFELEYNWMVRHYSTILDVWLNKRKPIEEQSEHCIKYIYDLLSER